MVLTALASNTRDDEPGTYFVRCILYGGEVLCTVYLYLEHSAHSADVPLHPL